MSYSKFLSDFYEKADRNDQYEQNWGYVNPVAAAYWRMRDEIVFENIISRFDTLSESIKVLEVGVGRGHELAKSSQLGVREHNLFGIDLVLDRIAKAILTYPSINFSQQDGTKLAFADASFDIVCQFTCLMHAPTEELQKKICQEMERVLKPGGIIIWWDIAPVRWRTNVLTRLCIQFAGKRGGRMLLYTIKEIIYELLVPSYRNKKMSKSNFSYIFPISSQDIVQMFQGLYVQAKYVGVEYSVWEYLWSKNRIVAQILWRTGWFYQHCFAIIEKPKI